MLAPAELGQRKGTSDRASQSTRAWLEEQDLGGFDEASAPPPPTSKENFVDMGLDDDYDYGQHLREIRPDGLFIPRVDGAAPRGPGSVVSHAVSASSRVSRLSRASIQLRGVSDVADAFESAEELAYSVGGAHNESNVLAEEDADAKAALDADLWAALHQDDTILEDEEEEEGFEELNDDFVLQADRPTELIADPVMRKKTRRRAAAADADAADDEADAEEEEEGEEGGGSDGGGRGQAEDVATGKGASAPTPVKRVNPFKEMFPSDSEGDDDDDDDDDDAAEVLRQMRQVSVHGGGRRQPGGGDARPERLLDARFDKLLSAEYSDDEIGELEEDDPRVAGHADIGEFDEILDEFLDAQKAKFVGVGELMDTGSSRAWARPKAEAFAVAPEPERSAIDRAGNGGLRADGVADGDESEGEDSDASIEVRARPSCSRAVAEL